MSQATVLAPSPPDPPSQPSYLSQDGPPPLHLGSRVVLVTVSGSPDAWPVLARQHMSLGGCRAWPSWKSKPAECQGEQPRPGKSNFLVWLGVD